MSMVKIVKNVIFILIFNFIFKILAINDTETPGSVPNLLLNYQEDVHNLSLRSQECPQLVTELIGGCPTLGTETPGVSFSRNCNYAMRLFPHAVPRVGHPPTSSVTSCGHSCDLSDKLWTSSRQFSDKLWTPSWSFSVINCEDFEDKVKNEDENDVFHNFHHAHCVPEPFLRHICQDESSCDSPFKYDASATRGFTFTNSMLDRMQSSSRQPKKQARTATRWE